ncbi:hypothetical protein PAPYR_7852 [Paratrimastix pyriformis]|uniref:Uncharacterized protein n=1 Tax=Paratrimastix pyriformis TaxID=342808 RepID=A0ABQ8UFC6_9EUKA|nr:hypothetical protein PAPYR_7852 [Paratrimastix pyriformis]
MCLRGREGNFSWHPDVLVVFSNGHKVKLICSDRVRPATTQDIDGRYQRHAPKSSQSLETILPSAPRGSPASLPAPPGWPGPRFPRQLFRTPCPITMTAVSGLGSRERRLKEAARSGSHPSRGFLVLAIIVFFVTLCLITCQRRRGPRGMQRLTLVPAVEGGVTAAAAPTLMFAAVLLFAGTAMGAPITTTPAGASPPAADDMWGTAVNGRCDGDWNCTGSSRCCGGLICCPNWAHTCMVCNEQCCPYETDYCYEGGCYRHGSLVMWASLEVAGVVLGGLLVVAALAIVLTAWRRARRASRPPVGAGGSLE